MEISFECKDVYNNVIATPISEKMSRKDIKKDFEETFDECKINESVLLRSGKTLPLVKNGNKTKPSNTKRNQAKVQLGYSKSPSQGNKKGEDKNNNKRPRKSRSPLNMPDFSKERIKEQTLLLRNHIDNLIESDDSDKEEAANVSKITSQTTYHLSKSGVRTRKIKYTSSQQV